MHRLPCRLLRLLSPLKSPVRPSGKDGFFGPYRLIVHDVITTYSFHGYILLYTQWLLKNPDIRPEWCSEVDIPPVFQSVSGNAYDR